MPTIERTNAHYDADTQRADWMVERLTPNGWQPCCTGRTVTEAIIDAETASDADLSRRYRVRLPEQPSLCVYANGQSTPGDKARALRLTNR